ncbi:hypothetical protein NEDG_00528 [Nematocida displodere]|uniref:Uncharacterized protein n=1 Tax=Nematocida displodere TaxID=1805483 RepID=A0A177EBS3_9MICR|nr:hypothetical protein NEDG_00528 [Nematocida displodere]
MLVQGRDLVVLGKSQKVTVYSLARGVEKAAVFLSKTLVTAVGCCPMDRFVLVGTLDGVVRMCQVESEGLESGGALEAAQEVCRMSLKVTSICVTDDIVYIGSENGVIAVVSIEKMPPRRGSIKEPSAGAEQGDGWMDKMESLDTNTLTETVSLGETTIHSAQYLFKSMREIKHTTPVQSVEARGQSVYVLDMRGRVKVFPSKVVYDHVSLIYCKKYLFCIDGATLFAEVGETLASVYFSESPIREVRSSTLGGFFFVLGDGTVEIMQLGRKGGKQLQRVPVDKDADHILIDSERSVIYTVSNGKITRVNTSYVWIDKPMRDLEIEERKIEKMVKEEEQDGEDEYFDVPAPLGMKDHPLPTPTKITTFSAQSGTAIGGNGGNGGEGHSGLEELFDDLSDEPERGTSKAFKDYLAADQEVPAKPSFRYPECAHSGISGSTFAKQGKNVFAFWSPECQVLLSDRTDHVQVDVTVRKDAVAISVLKDPEEITMACGSSQLLVLANDALLRVFFSASGLFSVSSQVLRRGVSEKIERVACGTEFFCLVTSDAAWQSVSVFSSNLDEVYSAVCKVRGVSASGEYLAVAQQVGGAISVRVFKWAKTRLVHLYTNPCPLMSLDFFAVNSEGVVVLESCRKIFAVGKERMVPLSSESFGVPLGLALNNVVYAVYTSTGALGLFPEATKYSPLAKTSLLGNKEVEIYFQLVEGAKEAASLPEKAAPAAYKEFLSLHRLDEDFSLQASPAPKLSMKVLTNPNKAPNATPNPNTSGLEEVSSFSQLENTSDNLLTPKRVKTVNPFARSTK